MTTRKPVPDLLYDALEGALRNEFYTAVANLAAELRQWSTDPAWSRLGLTAAEGAAVDEIVETTAAQRDLKSGDQVWVNATLLKCDSGRRFPYLVSFVGPNVSLWVPEGAVRARFDPPINAVPPDDDRATDEPLKVGDRVRILDKLYCVNVEHGALATVKEIDHEDFELPYRVQADTGAKWWVARDQIERVKPDPEVQSEAETDPDDDRPTDDLNVGDQVRLLDRSHNVGAHIGDVGKIIGIDDCIYDVDFANGAWLCTRDQIERVEPEPERLKFGQWVRRSDSGDIGIVIADDGLPEDKAPYLVQWQRSDQLWTNRARLTPIEPQL